MRSKTMPSTVEKSSVEGLFFFALNDAKRSVFSDTEKIF